MAAGLNQAPLVASPPPAATNSSLHTRGDSAGSSAVSLTSSSLTEEGCATKVLNLFHPEPWPPGAGILGCMAEQREETPEPLVIDVEYLATLPGARPDDSPVIDGKRATRDEILAYIERHKAAVAAGDDSSMPSCG